MAGHVAFLRAINLGATRRFPKPAIVRATEAAGFTDVETHINTGNVRFDTRRRSRPGIEAALESAYRAEAGFEVPTVVFTTAELAAVLADADALAPGDAHHVALLKLEPDAATRRELEAGSTGSVLVAVRGRAVHVVTTGGAPTMLATTARTARMLGVSTDRNVRVVRAVVEKWC